MKQCALLQLKPIQKQGRKASPQKELQPFLREPFLKISSTLSPTLEFLLEASLGVQRQWMLSRRGARTAWWLTSTPPPMPTSRVATLAYLKAKIAGKKSSKAKVEASVAYLKAFDQYGDDGFACSKSQKFIPEI